MGSDSKPSYTLLGSQNWPEFSADFEAYALSKGFYRILIGSESVPDGGNVAERKDWQSRHDLGCGKLFLALEESQKPHVRPLRTDLRAMWMKLESIHVMQRAGTRFNAWYALFNIKKSPEDSLSSVLTTLDKAMAEVRSLTPASATIEDIYNDLMAMAAIRSLPAEYNSFVSNLILMPDFTYDKVKEGFRLEETRRIGAQQEAEVKEALANLAVTPSIRPAVPITPTVVQANAAGRACYFCGHESHVMADCRKFKQSQQEAKQDVQHNTSQRGRAGRSNRRNNNGPKDKANAVTDSVEGANAVVTEFAGNASVLSDSPTQPLSDACLKWMADSGATSHMTPHKHWFVTYKPLVIPIRVAQGAITYSAGVGSVHIRPDVIDGRVAGVVEIQRVLHVPNLCMNLLSTTYLQACKGVKIVGKNRTMSFFYRSSLLFTATVNDKMVPYVNAKVLVVGSEHASGAQSTCPMDSTLWHRRLGHLNHADVNRLRTGNIVRGMKFDSDLSPDAICEPCLAGKQHRDVSKTSSGGSNEVGGLIHTDVHMLPVASCEGFRYWVTFIANASRHATVMFMKSKSDTFEAWVRFKAWFEKATGKKIKCVRDDKGGEYMSEAWEKHCNNEGIVRQHTVRAEPHQNGVAERYNRTLAEGVVAMLKEANLPNSWWKHAASVKVHVANRSPTQAKNGDVPLWRLFKKKVDVDHLRVFGCKSYVHVGKDKRKGLDSHTEPCIFVGYPAGYKGWLFYNPLTGKERISNSAKFDERSFPGLARKGFDGISAMPNPVPPRIVVDDDDGYVPDRLLVVPNQVGVDGNDDDDAPPDAIPSPPALRSPSPSPQPDPPRRSARSNKGVPPGEWWKVGPQFREHREPSPAIPDSDDDAAGFSNTVPYLTLPEALECCYHSAFAAKGHDTAPKTYAEAMSRPDAESFHQATVKELESLIENDTWEVAQLPAGRKSIGVRWVFVIKRKSDGTVERHKARLVAKGFLQRPGFDYNDTYASVVKWTTLRAMLALAALEDLDMESIDISSAFLNGEIDADVYIDQPEGFPQSDNPSDKLHLKKGIYGLKQSPRIWHEKLDKMLKSIGFMRMESDHSLWVYRRGEVRVVVPVFVDDMTLISKSKAEIERVKLEIGKHFKFRDLGPTEFLLGVKIERDRSNCTMYLSQKQYISDILERYGMSDCSPVKTPINPSSRLSSEQCASTPEEIEEMKHVPYIQAVGSLLYLAIATRADIAFAVALLARFNSNPGPAHWSAVKHLMRYLKGTMDLKLSYAPDPKSSELFVTFSDADHGGNKDSSKSTGGYVVKMGTGAVSWRSKLQPIVALSTTEAEYIAGVSAGQELMYFRNLFGKMGYFMGEPSTLYIDNILNCKSDQAGV